MKKLTSPCSSMLLLFGILVGVAPVYAEEVPASKCVTSATEATHAAAVAQMQKDIAPYAKDEKAARVIEQYKQNIETAWQAMQQPYCGYGAYGTASAIHSLSKSISRARATFLANVKHPSEVSVSLMAPAEVQVPEISVKGKKVSSAVEQKVKKAPSDSGMIQRGLHRGMKSAAVKAMQEKLANYYHLSAEDYVTGYFGPATQKLVIKFQLEKRLISGSSSSAAGLVGPKTAAALNQI